MGDTIVGIHRENDTNIGHGIQDEVKRAEEEHLAWCREQSRPKPLEIDRTIPRISPVENIAFDQEQLENLQRLGVVARLATQEEQLEAMQEEVDRRRLMELEAEQEEAEAGRKVMQKLVQQCMPELAAGRQDWVTITDGTYQSRDALIGQLAITLGMSIEELEDRIEGRRRDPRQQELFDPDVEATPHPDAPDHVNRTIRKTNLPGGFLMNTREFEKWVLESFVPIQDRIADIEGKLDYVLDLLKQSKAADTVQNDSLVKSRIGRLEQQLRELKAGKQ